MRAVSWCINRGGGFCDGATGGSDIGFSCYGDKLFLVCQEYYHGNTEGRHFHISVCCFHAAAIEMQMVASLNLGIWRLLSISSWMVDKDVGALLERWNMKPIQTRLWALTLVSD